MNVFRSASLRYTGVMICLLAGLVSWQASTADQAHLDHTHGIDHSEHQHAAHDIGDDHPDHDHQGDHHCPSCGVHFVALTPDAIDLGSPRMISFAFPHADALALRADSPPTPPPNA